MKQAVTLICLSDAVAKCIGRDDCCTLLHFAAHGDAAHGTEMHGNCYCWDDDICARHSTALSVDPLIKQILYGLPRSVNVFVPFTLTLKIKITFIFPRPSTLCLHKKIKQFSVRLGAPYLFARFTPFSHACFSRETLTHPHASASLS